MKAYQPHPAAQVFPLLTGARYASLMADIKKHGLIEPIWLHDGKILDGRNRYKACIELKIKPTFRKYTHGDPIAFAWSLNGERRHLGISQLAAIATKMLPALEVEAKKRQGQRTDIRASRHQGDAGKSTELAAAIVGVSAKSVQRANRVKKADPKLFARIESGKITVNKAGAILTDKSKDTPNQKQSPEVRAKAIRKLAREGNRASQIAAALVLSVQYVRAFARKHEIELPDAIIGGTHKINVNRVITVTVEGLAGYAQGLQTIKGNTGEIDQADAAAWADSLKESLPPIQKLRRKLQEIADGH